MVLLQQLYLYEILKKIAIDHAEKMFSFEDRLTPFVENRSKYKPGPFFWVAKAMSCW